MPFCAQTPTSPASRGNLPSLKGGTCSSAFTFGEIVPFSKPLIDADGKKLSEIFYVIDGQQRLTSLLLLFKDWKIFRGGEEVRCEIPITYNPTNKKFCNTLAL